jgi:hypothetical protein
LVVLAQQLLEIGGVLWELLKWDIRTVILCGTSGLIPLVLRNVLIAGVMAWWSKTFPGSMVLTGT